MTVVHEPLRHPGETGELAAARRHLVRDFPDVPPETIDAELELALTAFEGARVRTYVPLLAEKQVRHRLGPPAGRPASG